MSDFNAPVTTENKAELTARPEMSSASIWASFQEMAKDPTIDAAKMQTMYDLQKTMIEDLRQEEFNQAKFKAMMNMPTIIKNKIVSTRSGELMYRYSDFKHLYLTVKPILSKELLVLDFDVDEMGTETKVPFLRVAPIIRHQNGYVWQGSYMPVPITAANASISLTQAAKGAVETGKRTVTISCLGITEDEDSSITGVIENGTTPDQDQLVDDAQKAASKGSKAYTAWMGGLTNVQKGWLVTHDHHANMSRAAKVADQQE